MDVIHSGLTRLSSRQNAVIPAVYQSLATPVSPDPKDCLLSGISIQSYDNFNVKTYQNNVRDSARNCTAN